MGSENQEARIKAPRAEDLCLETLLREANHRVANSLQIVAAVVGMQSRAVLDLSARTVLQDTQCRIQSVVQLHRLLCTSGVADTVAMDDYLGMLVARLEETWSTPAAPRILTLVSDPIYVKAGKALSLGMIVNELVANACKYAYSLSAPGEVRITLLRKCSQRLMLVVEDDGCGVQHNHSAEGLGLGANMIKALATSLQATLSYDQKHAGVRAILCAAH